MLNLARARDQAIIIHAGGHRIEVLICEFRRGRGGAPIVNVGIKAPPEVLVLRKELECPDP